MKWWLLFIFFFFYGCAQIERKPAATAGGSYHFIFDIDWTLVAEVKPPARADQRIVEVEGKKYFINIGAESLIQKISQNPDIKISFFSGGTKSRNIELLKKIKLSDGRSLFDIAHKVLSFEDLVEMEGTNDKSKFVDRYKKDLTKVSDQLDRVIMFDDTAGFALPGKGRQQDQVFFLGTAYLPFDQYEYTDGLSGPYIPSSKEAWLLDRQKLVLLERAYAEVLKKYQDSGNNQLLTSLMKAEESKLRFHEHEWNSYSRRLWNTHSPNRQCTELMGAFIH